MSTEPEFFATFEEAPKLDISVESEKTEVAPLVEVAPLIPEVAPAPVIELGKVDFVYKEHEVRFADNGDCFFSKPGHCLGCPGVASQKEAKEIIDRF